MDFEQASGVPTHTEIQKYKIFHIDPGVGIAQSVQRRTTGSIPSTARKEYIRVTHACMERIIMKWKIGEFGHEPKCYAVEACSIAKRSQYPPNGILEWSAVPRYRPQSASQSLWSLSDHG
jgi:hypothetical protein